ncbi:MAG: hypothetical protein ACJAVT_000797 [Yoonia sp.]|jgi:hypothetical protein
MKLSADNFRKGGIYRRGHSHLHLHSSLDDCGHLPRLSDPACQPMTRIRQTIANRNYPNNLWPAPRKIPQPNVESSRCEGANEMKKSRFTEAPIIGMSKYQEAGLPTSVPRRVCVLIDVDPKTRRRKGPPGNPMTYLVMNKIADKPHQHLQSEGATMVSVMVGLLNCVVCSQPS